MATGTERYAPLRDAAPGTASPTQQTPPSEEIGKNPTQIERTAVAHDARRFTVAIDEQGQPTRWPMQQDMRSQNMAAHELVKQRYEQRQQARQEPEQDSPEPQRGETRRELTFFEDRHPARNYGDLKREHADSVQPTEDKEQDKDKGKADEQGRSLSFYEDRNPPDLSRTR
jgi:hypothetical protein